MKLIPHDTNFFISSIPVNLVKKLGWAHGTKLRPYVKDDLLIIEPLETGKCLKLYQAQNKNNSISYSLNYLKKSLVQSLSWRAGTYLVATLFADKLIIKESTLNKITRVSGWAYIEEKMKLDQFVITKIQELFEA